MVTSEGRDIWVSIIVEIEGREMTIPEVIYK